MCAYNAEATIDECLTSLENLSYPDLELIMVNDGSTDCTCDIARQHLDKQEDDDRDRDQGEKRDQEPSRGETGQHHCSLVLRGAGPWCASRRGQR